MKKNSSNPILRLREAANRRFTEITPQAVNMIWDMAQDPDINAAARVQLLSLIVNRGLGKQEETVKLISEQEMNEEAKAELEALFSHSETDDQKTLKKSATQKKRKQNEAVQNEQD